MWKCPKCETINEFAFCSLCGEAKPQQHQTKNMSETNDKVLKLLILVITIFVILAFVFLCIVPIASKMLSEKQTAIQEDPHTTYVPEPTSTPATHSSSVYVPRKIGNVYSGGTRGSIDEIIIETSEYVVPELSTLQDPSRVVIDFYGFSLSDTKYSTNISGYNYKNIRKADHDSYARVVLDISRNCYVNLESIDDKCIITLSPK